jgi:hypothetical protein
LKNKNLSFYGCYVNEIKPNKIIKISKENYPNYKSKDFPNVEVNNGQILHQIHIT